MFNLTFPPQGRQNGAAGSGTLSRKGFPWVGGTRDDPRALPSSAIQQTRRLGLRAPGKKRVAAALHSAEGWFHLYIDVNVLSLLELQPVSDSISYHSAES